MIEMALKLLFFCFKIAQRLVGIHLQAPSSFTQYLVSMSVCDTLELHQFVPGLEKITCFCFNYSYNYNLRFSITITIIQVQVIVIQLQFRSHLQ